MTQQDDGRIEVTIYEDDIVVSGPSYVISVIREIDIPTILSRVFFEYACAVVVIKNTQDRYVILPLIDGVVMMCL